MAKPATKAEKAHMDRVAGLGCVICTSPATIHHCGTGAGGRKNHMKVIPLCPAHHQGKNGVDGKERGMNKGLWQERFGTEEYWLQEVSKKLAFLDSQSCHFFSAFKE